MEQTRITFGEWLPDQPTLLGVLQDAKMCDQPLLGTLILTK